MASNILTNWRKLHFASLILFMGILIGFFVITTNAAPAVVSGELQLWHRVSITFDGPNTDENATPNPFTDYRLNVTFVHQSGTTVVVPGFYAADGDAANTSATGGNKWRVHFMPTLVGDWTYTASFRTGTDIAVSLDPAAGISAGFFDGESGTFTVTASDKTGKDFRGKGLLRYVDGHYMRFAGSGEYFLKNGADSPENFLAYVDFDDTYDTGGRINGFLHEYAPHAGDWTPGDPSWGGGRGTEIIGAINYLSSRDVNSIYFITYNLDGGDGQDVWPWTNDTERERFDVSKLDQWEIVFSHMTQNGLQLHVLLTEYENNNLLGGSSSLNNLRMLYYRELVARFSHHPVLQWNIGEENTNTDAERISFAQYIRAIDAYDHPTTVHTFDSLKTGFFTADPGTFYDGLLGNPYLEMTSIQDQTVAYNGWAVDLRQRSTAAGRPWVVYGDENAAPTDVQPDMSNVGEIVRDGMWGNLIGGGAGVEWYFGYHTPTFGDVQLENFADADTLWRQADIAIDFFNTYLPFWVMEPNNPLGDAIDKNPWVLARPGDIYAVFFPEGTTGARIDLQSSTDTFNVRWFDPNVGVFTGTTSTITGPSFQTLMSPPYETDREWLALIENQNGIRDLPPLAVDDNKAIAINSSLQFNILENDIDDFGVDSSTVTLLDAPASVTDLGNGSILFNGSSTPDIITFDYLVEDISNQTSNIATIIIVVNALSTNSSPAASRIETQAPSIELFDPAISKIGLLQPGELGLQSEKLEWIISVQNTSSVAGNNVVVVDTLRSELRVDDVTTSIGSATATGQTVTAIIPELAPGEIAQISIFTTMIRRGGVVSNTACVEASNSDGRPCATAVPITSLPQTGESLWGIYKINTNLWYQIKTD